MKDVPTRRTSALPLFLALICWAAPAAAAPEPENAAPDAARVAAPASSPSVAEPAVVQAATGLGAEAPLSGPASMASQDAGRPEGAQADPAPSSGAGQPTVPPARPAPAPVEPLAEPPVKPAPGATSGNSPSAPKATVPQTVPADPTGSTGPAARPGQGAGSATQPPGRPAPDSYLVIPLSVSAEELERGLASGGLTVIDIRSPADFADYRIPGAVNLAPEALLRNAGQLPGDPSSRVILVDRDGSRAHALATIMTQQTTRTVLALKGGLEAWWRTVELGRIVRPTPLPATPGAAGPAPAKAAPPAAPTQPKTKSAGC